jgi:hypothetical protein
VQRQPLILTNSEMVIDLQPNLEQCCSSFSLKCPLLTACTNTLLLRICKCLISRWGRACLILYYPNDWRISWRHCNWMCITMLVQVSLFYRYRGSLGDTGGFLTPLIIIYHLTSHKWNSECFCMWELWLLIKSILWMHQLMGLRYDWQSLSRLETYTVL